MGPRNLLILFFSTVAVSLVILIIFFSLFFKNVNLDFNTRLPESAPDVGSRFKVESATMNPESKADGLTRSTVNVPPDYKEPEADTQHAKDKVEKEEFIPSDVDLPPISDDAFLENDYHQPLPEARPLEKPPAPEKTGTDRATSRPPEPSLPAMRPNKPVEPRKETQAQPMAMPLPIQDLPAAEPESAGPPIPQ